MDSEVPKDARGDVAAEANDPIVVARVDSRIIVHPVVAMRPSEGDGLAQPMVFGTSFCIGPGIFVTAGHVLRQVLEIGIPAIVGTGRSNQLRAVRARQVEAIDSHDVGVLMAEVPAATVLHWADEPVDMLQDVSAIGYPYSIDWDQERDAWKMGMRGFKGSIITRRQIWRLSGKPIGYEVDCHFHPGMSGAPLLCSTAQFQELKLVGMVLGEQRTKFGGRRICFGEALDVLSLGEVQSEIAGEYLFKTGIGGKQGPRSLDDLRATVLARYEGRSIIDG